MNLDEEIAYFERMAEHADRMVRESGDHPNVDNRLWGLYGWSECRDGYLRRMRELLELKKLREGCGL